DDELVDERHVFHELRPDRPADFADRVRLVQCRERDADGRVSRASHEEVKRREGRRVEGAPALPRARLLQTLRAQVAGVAHSHLRPDRGKGYGHTATATKPPDLAMDPVPRAGVGSIVQGTRRANMRYARLVSIPLQ